MECEFNVGDQVKLKPINELIKLFFDLWDNVDKKYIEWHQNRINNIFTIKAIREYPTKHGNKIHLWLEEDDSLYCHWSEFFIPVINIENNNNIPIIFGDMEYK